MDSPESLINAGMYPVVYCLSDQALAAGKQPTLAERWVMAAGKGAIGFFGPGNTPFSAPWDNFSEAFWPLAWSNPDGLTIGEEIDSVLRSLSSQYSNLTNAIDLIYLGDPAIVVWNPQQPLSAAPPSDPEQGIALYPNPFHESLWLDLALEKAAKVNLQVLDVSGRQVLARDCGLLAAANHHIALDIPSHLAAGMYIARISAGSKWIYKKLLHD